MIDISLKDVKLAFEEGKNILDGLTFEVNSGEHVGLLGSNGAGKTTLFRLLVGALAEDEGAVVLAPGKRIGLISQIPVYPDGYTVEDVLKCAHRRIYDLEARLRALTERMAVSAGREVMAEYDALTAEYERLGGYDIDHERNRVANGLDLDASMRARQFADLSGGEKTRVNLARLILEDTDILLLDEPTNHLDLHATQWLEEYIKKFRGTVIAISHDRYFLDAVAERTMEMVHGRMEFYSGNYSFYVAEKRRRYEELLKQYEKSQKEIERLTVAADQLHLWAFMGNDKLHKRAFSMDKRIEKLKTAPAPERERKMKVRFGEREFSGDEVLLAEGLGKSYEGRTLFSDFDILITPGERIAITGDNGAGKTTLLRVMLGEIAPDAGRSRLGPAIKSAYLPQIVRFDHPERSLLDTLIYDENCSPQSARNRLASFKFAGEDVFKCVGALSGGELSRLRLCMLMKDDINLLILDEPTNHLDLPSREWMEEALSDYGETLLFVSHDRYFIDRFATRILAFEQGTITDFRGGWSEYVEFKARQETVTQTVKQEARKRAPKKPAQLSPEKAVQRVERDIEKREAQLRELDARSEEFCSDYQKLIDISQQRAQIEKELETLYARWEELSAQMDL